MPESEEMMDLSLIPLMVKPNNNLCQIDNTVFFVLMDDFVARISCTNPKLRPPHLTGS
jgi:hypothetical protein